MTAPEIRYRPGTLRAVVSPLGVAVLPAEIDAVLLDRVWHDLESGHGLGAVLESLTGAFGTSLRLIPPFAVVALDGSSADVRIAVRGDLAIEAVESEGADPVTVSGAEVTTWSERVLRAPHSLSVTSSSAPVSPEELGIASGVVLAASLTLSFSPADASSAQEGLAPAPASAPAPAPAQKLAEAPGASTAHEGLPDAPRAAYSEHSAPTGTPEATGAPDEVDSLADIPEATVVELPDATVADVLEAPVADATVVDVPDASATAAPEAPVASSAHEGLPDAPGAAEIEHSTMASALDGSGNATEAAADPTEASVDEVPEATVGELPDDAYDHLWGATVVKSVETAAVREVEEDDEGEHAAASDTPPAPPATPTPTPEPAPAEVAEPTPSAWTAPPSTGLIDSVPGFGTLGAPAPAPTGTPAPFGTPAPTSGAPGGAAAPTPAPVDGSASAPTPGGTSASAPEQRRPLPPPSGYAAEQPAPAAPASAAPTASASTASAADDHDGLTVTVSELEAMRRLAAAGGDTGTGSGTAPDGTGGPADAPVALGRIVLSTGESHDLDRPIIIGRRPRANRVQGDRMPLLITVESPEQDISRNHLEVRLEGRHVLVADMHTTNGSVLHREGTPPLRLSPDDAVLVLSDDLVDLGDGVTVRFEDIP